MSNTKEMAVIEKQVNPVISQAKKVTITNSKELQGATEILSKLNKALDTITEDKERITKPLNATLKEVRSRYKPIEDMLGDEIARIRREMINYQTEAKRVADEEAMKIAARVGSGKGKLKVETAIAQMDNIEKPDEQVVGETGMIKFRTVRKFEVVDFAKVPDMYKVIHETTVRLAMSAGQEIPGIRFFDEQVPVNLR